jgi:5-methylcytosine-specific restriction protein B
MTDNLQPLLEIIHAGSVESWSDRNRRAFEALFGAPAGRYRTAAKDVVTLRAPEFSSDSGVHFAAYIHPSNSTSGPYGGMSFVIFPASGEPCLVAMVVGTQGLSPDEAILGRPGHARKIQAICGWLNKQYGKGQQIAWAKQDPTRVDLDIPDSIKRLWSPYQKIFERYGKVIYAAFTPTADAEGSAAAVTAVLDVMFEERGQKPLAQFTEQAEAIRSVWFEHLMASTTRSQVTELLDSRRYVILQGPPGTGKTLMAGEILRDEYASIGRSIQFHPNTTYENFIGGLAPVAGDGSLGFRFAPAPGFLMESAAAALNNPSKRYLLHIDEINRADLGKILGEAIYLLEPEPGFERKIDLPYDFGKPFHRTFFLPPNLHILGTMNSADRSIAIVDVAVRRRFAFVPLWPSMQVVEQHGCQLTQKAFRDLISIFVEHASDDALSLVPGHSYFLAKDEAAARSKLRTNLAPLLTEYLAQGYVTGFAESMRSYLQWLDSL